MLAWCHLGMAFGWLPWDAKSLMPLGHGSWMVALGCQHIGDASRLVPLGHGSWMVALGC